MVEKYILTYFFVFSLPVSLNQCLNGGESSPLIACRRLMQLVSWLEAGSLRDLPACVAQPIRLVLYVSNEL